MKLKIGKTGEVKPDSLETLNIPADTNLTTLINPNTNPQILQAIAATKHTNEQTETKLLQTHPNGKTTRTLAQNPYITTKTALTLYDTLDKQTHTNILKNPKLPNILKTLENNETLTTDEKNTIINLKSQKAYAQLLQTQTLTETQTTQIIQNSNYDTLQIALLTCPDKRQTILEKLNEKL